MLSYFGKGASLSLGGAPWLCLMQLQGCFLSDTALLPGATGELAANLPMGIVIAALSD